MSSDGWVCLHRKIMRSAIWHDAELLKLFVMCVMLANHKDGEVLAGQYGRTPVKVARGQFVTGINELWAQYYPKLCRAKTGVKHKTTLWRWLKTLADMQNLSLDMQSHFTVVTVNNFDTYNRLFSGECNDTCNGAATSLQQRCNGAATAVRTNNNTNKENKEDNEEKKIAPSRSLAASEPAASPILLTFPCVGDKGKEWHLTGAKVAEYQESYPALDILAECRKARQWCIDNPGRRKTARGMPTFLNRWLERAQNQSGGSNGRPGEGMGTGARLRTGADYSIIDQKTIRARPFEAAPGETGLAAGDAAQPGADS